MIIQERDLEILEGLLNSRFATLRHISGLHFKGKTEAGKKRIQKLKSEKLISEKRGRCYEPSFLFLTEKGLKTLRAEGHLSKYPEGVFSGFKRRMTISDFTLKHEIAVLDVKVAIHEAIRKEASLHLMEFSTWPLLHQFELGRKGSSTFVVVKPDGFIRIKEQKTTIAFEYTYFLEVDRGSETLSTLVNKAVCYNRFYREGGMAERNGKPAAAFREYPFRVLIVVKSPERQINLAKALLSSNPPILTQACITTFDELFANPLGRIWLQPMALKQQRTSSVTQEMKRRFLE